MTRPQLQTRPQTYRKPYLKFMSRSHGEPRPQTTTRATSEVATRGHIHSTDPPSYNWLSFPIGFNCPSTVPDFYQLSWCQGKMGTPQNRDPIVKMGTKHSFLENSTTKSIIVPLLIVCSLNFFSKVRPLK